MSGCARSPELRLARVRLGKPNLVNLSVMRVTGSVVTFQYLTGRTFLTSFPVGPSCEGGKESRKRTRDKLSSLIFQVIELRRDPCRSGLAA